MSQQRATGKMFAINNAARTYDRKYNKAEAAKEQARTARERVLELIEELAAVPEDYEKYKTQVNKVIKNL